MPEFVVELHQLMRAHVKVEAVDAEAALELAEYVDDPEWRVGEPHAVGAEETTSV